MRSPAIFLAFIASLAAAGCAATATDQSQSLTAVREAPMQLSVDARAIVEWSDAYPGSNYSQRQTTSIAIGGGQTLVLEFADLPPEVFDLGAAGGEHFDLTVTILTSVLENGDVHHAVTLSATGHESGVPQTIAQPSLTAHEGATSTVHIGMEADGGTHAGFMMDLVASRIE